MSNVAIVNKLAFIPFGTRVIVEQDDFRSGFECKSCGGATKVTCLACGGTGKIRSFVVTFGDKECVSCNGSGQITCFDCKGRGALIEIPETTKRRPNTGIIIAIGPQVKLLTEKNIGDRVVYPKFSGNAIEIDNSKRQTKTVIVILDENELMASVNGVIPGVNNMTDFSTMG